MVTFISIHSIQVSASQHPQKINFVRLSRGCFLTLPLWLSGSPVHAGSPALLWGFAFSPLQSQCCIASLGASVQICCCHCSDTFRSFSGLWQNQQEESHDHSPLFLLPFFTQYLLQQARFNLSGHFDKCSNIDKVESTQIPSHFDT